LQKENGMLNLTDSKNHSKSQVLQNTLKRVERSFQNFFNGAGYPRFQGQRWKDWTSKVS